MPDHAPYTIQPRWRGQRNGATSLVFVLLLALPPVAHGMQAPAPSVRVSATLLLNGFRNSARVNNVDVPTLVLPRDTTATLPASGLGASIRQTRVRLLVLWPDFKAGSLSGELDADFFGGQFASGGGRTHPVLRVRRAFGVIRWRHGEILVGQESPPVFEVSPTTLASSGLPGFASAGNLWLWLPQLRGTLFVNPGRGVRVGLQGAVLAPSAGEPQDPFLTQPDRAERSDRPSFEGRMLVRWGEGDRAGEIGAGAHVGWIATGESSLVTSRAVGASARIPVGTVLELSGEAMSGRAIAGLGGGAIGQNLTGPGTALRTRGGWAQALGRLGRGWEVALGAGIDDPTDADVPAGGRLRNTAVTAHLGWRALPIVVAIEYRRLQTTYAEPVGRRSNNHFNLAVGLDF